jgi:hypothetical protein
MDCLNRVFNHADLGPTNIIVEDQPNSGKVGIIDFELPVTFLEAGSGLSFGYLVRWTSPLRSLMTRTGGEKKFENRSEPTASTMSGKLGKSGGGTNRPKPDLLITHMESCC